MRRIASLLTNILLLLALSGCSDATSGEYNDRPHGTVSIAHLKSMATSESVVITDDISIEGYVVANDLFGEYYKSIIVSDESGGIEVGIDLRRTATEFPISARVVIHCSGLALGSYAGQLMLGAQPENEFTVDRISAEDVSRYITVNVENPMAIEPTPITIAELTPAHISNYVVIKDLNFGDQAGKAWCEFDTLTGKYLTTQRTARDAQGYEIAIRTISSCDYRNEVIPRGECDLYGIVEYFNGEYSLRIINHGIVVAE